MPKTRSRKRGGTRGSVRRHHASRLTTAVTPLERPQVKLAGAGTRAAAPNSRGIQGLVMAALVAIGCWAFAYYTFLFNRDANSYLFAGMAALLALIWSISFFVRLRKWRQAR